MRIFSLIASLFLIPFFALAQGEDLCEELLARHGFLEEIEGNQALEWARAQNERTLARLKSDPRFAQIKAQALELLNAKDRIAYGSFRGKFLRNFWQDEKNPRGIVRRTTLRRYLSQDPRWETVLDIDALAAREGLNWVYKGIDQLKDSETHALVFLSRGGKDATIVREFDLEKKEFVSGGFELPESKSSVIWLDQDTLIVASAFEESEVTSSGYPRILKLWKRGASLKDAPIIFEGKKEDVSVSASILRREDGRKYVVLSQLYNFFEENSFLVNDKGLRIRIPLPLGAAGEGSFKGNLLITLNSDWVFEGVTFKQGSLLYVNLDEFVKDGPIRVELVFEPTSQMAVNGVLRTKDHIFVNVLDNVRGRLIQMHRGTKGWLKQEVPLPPMGTISVMSASDDHHQMFINYEDFLTPDTLYLYNARTGKLRPAKSLPPRFDSSKYVAEQFFATSRDGTQVPYFVVRSKEMELNGKNPTYLYGYGGFEVSQLPFYIDRQERLWLREGGVFVQANIRGGGEFGPAWHQAALKENRQRAFDDFIAVAEDLIARKITSPRHLGIRGGSNGGLLVGAVAVQRPDLFHAVACDVPLLDMMRYHKLLAGASWMAEYGDPDDPKLRPFIFAYSPYHNVKGDMHYPEIFFETSTKDDRVHPAHARKMAYYMGELGYSVLYFEDIDGGHGGGITPEHAAESAARFYTYFFQKLKD